MKMQCFALAAAVLAVASTGTAFAAFEQHSVDYTYTLAENDGFYPRLSLPGFDDQGGLRTLTKVEIRVQATVSATLVVENETANPLSEWAVEGQHLVLTGFERENPEAFGPFAFLGGLGFEPAGVELAPSDGVPGSGPDFYVRSDSVFIDTFLEVDPSELPFFLGGGNVIAVVGPYTEFLLDGVTQYDPTLQFGDVSVSFTDLAQSGKLIVTYEYSAVPEPASAAAVIGVGLLAGLRRRR